MNVSLQGLQKRIGVAFDNEKLLTEALTHRSYLNENPGWETPHNERLEFLGDAVLELSATEYLFNCFPEYDEGRLTSIRSALVNHMMLSKVAGEIGLNRHLMMSRGEMRASQRAKEAMLGNAVEALIGAIYLDQGYDAADNFIDKFILVHLGEVMEQKLYDDAKSVLQETVQEKLRVTPSYKVLSESGPDHAKTFVVGVYFNGNLISEGTGCSKQEAERDAARKALEEMDI